jgi:hypothetical protein
MGAATNGCCRLPPASLVCNSTWSPASQASSSTVGMRIRPPRWPNAAIAEIDLPLGLAGQAGTYRPQQGIRPFTDASEDGDQLIGCRSRA